MKASCIAPLPEQHWRRGILSGFDFRNFPSLPRKRESILRQGGGWKPCLDARFRGHDGFGAKGVCDSLVRKRGRG
jgi:hypothetical protein